MRAWLVLLAACSHTAASAPPAAPVTAAAPQSPAPARPAPTQTLARVGVEQGAWIDVRIDGIDAAAQELCEHVVAQQIAWSQAVKLRELRGCATEPLPPGVVSPVQLVELDAVEADHVMLGEVVRGNMPKHDLAGTGTLLRVMPLDTRQHCEAMRAEMEGEDQRREAEINTQSAHFLDEELQKVADRERTVCADAQRQRECENVKLMRGVLERRRASPKPMTHPQRSCRVP